MAEVFWFIDAALIVAVLYLTTKVILDAQSIRETERYIAALEVAVRAKEDGEG